MNTIIEATSVSKWFARSRNSSVRFPFRRRDSLEDSVRAVDDVSFSIHKGEVLGLVGESGCGKSTLGRIIAGLITPSYGSVNVSIEERVEPQHHTDAARKLAVQMVFQDPLASLNPRRTVLDLIGEAPMVHRLCSRGTQHDYVHEVMVRVGLDPALDNRYAHQLSGGQRQRVGIARALAVNPAVLICDESVAALDVSIQAQIINLLLDLKESLGLTLLFISHDLGLVEHISDRVLIMYLGRIVESGSVRDIFRAPQHPYTQALLDSAPRLDGQAVTFAPISGDIPSPLHPPSGCHFHTRCEHVLPICRLNAPILVEISPGHCKACHLEHIATLGEDRFS
jgi:oligopeptide/dipeptide ABC transporter ATP-binding protein